MSIELLIIINIVFIVIAIYAKSQMDMAISNLFPESKKQYNVEDSYKNKYASPLQPYEKVWYYPKWIKPLYKESFPFSTTVFVCITDYWHYMQFVCYNLLFLLISFDLFKKPIELLISFIVIKIIYAIEFNLFFKEYKN